MAVIEIGAATLPGFPYTFPYRTGVRAYASPVSTVNHHFFTEINTSIVASADVVGKRYARVISTSVEVVATASADALVTRFGATATAVIGAITAGIIQDYATAASLPLSINFSSRIVSHRELSAFSLITAGRSSHLRLNAFSGAHNLNVTIGLTAAASLQAVSSTTVGIVAAGFAPTVTMQAVVGADVAASASLSSRVSWGQFITATIALAVGRTGFLHRHSFGSSSTSIFADTEPEISTPGSALHARTNALLNVSTHIVADSRVERYAVAELEASATTATIVARTTYGVANNLPVTATGATEALRIQYVEAPITDAVVTIDNVVYKLDGLCDAELAVLSSSSAAQKAFLVGSAELTVTDSSFPTVDADFVILASLPVVAISTGNSNFVVYTNSGLEISVASSAEILREVYAETFLELAVALDNEIHYAYFADTNLDILVENLPAIMLYRHSGGNPMWLTFFYAGNGRQNTL